MRTPDIKRKEKYGYGFVKYTSKKLRFTIFEDGGGYTEVLDKGDQIFCMECGTHAYRASELLFQAKEMERKAALFREAATEMKKYNYNTPI